MERSGAIQFDAQQALELAREIHRDSGVHGALFIKESLLTFECENPFVPNVGVYVQPFCTIEPEANEVVGFAVVTWKSQWDHERFAIEREEQLATIGVVIAVP